MPELLGWQAFLEYFLGWQMKQKIYWTEISRYSHIIHCCMYIYIYTYSISMIFTYSHYKYDGFSPFICRLQDDLQARGWPFLWHSTSQKRQIAHRLVESGHQLQDGGCTAQC